VFFAALSFFRLIRSFHVVTSSKLKLKQKKFFAKKILQNKNYYNQFGFFSQQNI